MTLFEGYFPIWWRIFFSLGAFCVIDIMINYLTSFPGVAIGPESL